MNSNLQDAELAAAMADPRSNLTAEEVEPRARRSQHNSLAATARHTPVDEASATAVHDFASRPAHKRLPSSSSLKHDARGPRGPAVDRAADSTPRSEVPSISEAVNEALLQRNPNPEAEPSYFSPQPLRVLSSKIPHTATSTEPSPTDSAAAPGSRPSSSIASPWRGVRPSPISAEAARLPHQRELSAASVASFRANSVGAVRGYIPPQPREGPVFPNQSYAALQMQQHTAHSPHILRARSSQPNHHSGYSVSHISSFGTPGENYRDAMESGSRTVGNSPASSPGLFNPNEPRHRFNPQQPEDHLYSPPWLHYMHRQPPKETHVADVDVNPMSGRKNINQYEILDELGRGMHGKVKLGRNIQSGEMVAIKIIDRYSKRRRLGKNTSHEDKIKREIAILKKARHDNIVGLLEVIDDPSKNKVYIILEHVQLGEVKWRKEGAKEICLVEWRRFQRESEGIFENDTAQQEDDEIIRLAHERLQRQQRRQARQRRLRKLQETGTEAWSLELGGDSEDDWSDDNDLSSKASTRNGERSSNQHQHPSRQGSGTSQDTSMETAFRAGESRATRAEAQDILTGLEGTMYGAYDTESARGRTPSITGSASSSHLTESETEIPEHFQYVPVMTIDKARDAFRDTVLGLEYLHYQNVIHRDIKPANLLMTSNSRVKISDFGVSYLGTRPRQESTGNQSESDVAEDDEAIELAKTVGTPAFYAPELCQTDLDIETKKIDKAIDIWALGVTLFCLVYGRVPFHDHNQFVLMKRITEAEPYIPRYRLKPVEDHSSSRPNSHGRIYHAMPSNTRADHDLDYEPVDDDLRDLLQQLLIKDPRQRITIPEIKRHRWLTQGIENNNWADETDKDLQGKKIEISKEDIEKAVVPFSVYLEKMRSTVVTRVKEFTRSLTRRDSKKRERAMSTTSGQDVPPSISAASSSSTISQDSRRPSLGPGMYIFEALNKSREVEHPLSHSVTASPDTSIRSRFFDSPEARVASPAHSTEGREHPSSLGLGSRPRLPDRAHSTLSSAASIRTVRPSDRSDGGYPLSPDLPPALPGTPTALDSPGGTHLSGIYGGMPKRAVHDARTEDKRSGQQREVNRAKSIDRMFGKGDDAHGEPSLAISTAFASGHVDQPDLLKELSPTILGTSPSFADSYSFAHPERTSSRQSSISSVSSRLHRTWAANNEADVSLDLSKTLSRSPLSRDWEDSLGKAKDEFARRKARDDVLNHERKHTGTRPRPPSALSQNACSTSPDRETVFQRHRKVEDFLHQQRHQPPYATSPITKPVITEAQPRAIVSSSSEEQFTCISQSTSNPSVPSVVSATSSVALDEFDVAKMTPAASGSSIHLNQFSTPTDDPAGYDGDHAVESDDESSDEDFLVMGKKKPAPTLRRSESITNAELARSNVRKELGYRRRSNRSGSNGTVKKVPPPGSD